MFGRCPSPWLSLATTCVYIRSPPTSTRFVSKHTPMITVCYQPICNSWPDLKPSGQFQNCPSQCTYMYAHLLWHTYGKWFVTNNQQLYGHYVSLYRPYVSLHRPHVSLHRPYVSLYRSYIIYVNLMSFNTSKCKQIVISRKKSQHVASALSLGGQILEIVNHYISTWVFIYRQI